MPPRPNPRAKGPAAIALAAVAVILVTAAAAQDHRAPGVPATPASPATPGEYHFLFWNVQNLFDPDDDPRNDGDDEFLPGRGWTDDVYRRKLEQLARTLAPLAPHLLAVCEVENRRVLEDLAASPTLSALGYRIVHHDSADSRGIDVALLHRAPFEVADFARDVAVHSPGRGMREILEVNLTASGTRLTVFVNHWTSRRGGAEASATKRALFADTLRQIVLNRPDDAELLILGDFNDEPFDTSIRERLGAVRDRRSVLEYRKGRYLYNPTWRWLAAEGAGTYYFNDTWEWHLFDQCIVSKGLLLEPGFALVEDSLAIVAPDHLRESDRRPRGFRAPRPGSDAGRGAESDPGTSDHLPIAGTLRLR